MLMHNSRSKVSADIIPERFLSDKFGISRQIQMKQVALLTLTMTTDKICLFVDLKWKNHKNENFFFAFEDRFVCNLSRKNVLSSPANSIQMKQVEPLAAEVCGQILKMCFHWIFNCIIGCNGFHSC